jgi:hypothetical protein
MNTLARAGEVGGGRKQRFLRRGRRGNDEAGDDMERPGSISWLEKDRGIKAQLLVVSDHRGMAGAGGSTARSRLLRWRSMGFLLSRIRLGRGERRGEQVEADGVGRLWRVTKKYLEELMRHGTHAALREPESSCSLREEEDNRKRRLASVGSK